MNFSEIHMGHQTLNIRYVLNRLVCINKWALGNVRLCFLPAGHVQSACPADTKIVLRFRVKFVCVCVCSSAIITCGNLHISVTMPL